MEPIPARERFSKHENSKTTPPELIKKAVIRAGLDPVKSKVRRLSGGYMNANFLAEQDDKAFVIRVYSTSMDTAEREYDLLDFLAAKPPMTPKVFSVFTLEDRPVMIMEYLAGETLENRLSGGDPVNPKIYRDIGKQLGDIHNITFDQSGFVKANVQVGNEYKNFSIFIRQFIEKTLKNLENQPERLALDLNKRFSSLVRDKWDLVLATEPRRQLVHCDFNPKNIMISKEQTPSLLGVIDWEFTLAGNGLIDLGNFFRFYYDYPDQARTYFAAGYRSTNESLPESWEDVSRLLDLGNMCSFLERKEDYQKSFRTARVVIKSTLEYFGY